MEHYYVRAVTKDDIPVIVKVKPSGKGILLLEATQFFNKEKVPLRKVMESEGYLVIDHDGCEAAYYINVSLEEFNYKVSPQEMYTSEDISKYAKYLLEVW